MFEVEHTDYGLRLTVSGQLDPEQAAEFDQAGIDERVIDATAADDWEHLALDWIRHGREPDG